MLHSPAKGTTEESVMLAEEIGPTDSKRHVTVAINYKVSLVDDFVGLQRQQSFSAAADTGALETTPSNPTGPLGDDLPHRQESSCDSSSSSSGNNNASSTFRVNENQGSISITRRSNRDKQKQKREVTLARTRVRYDMLQVPHAMRNPEFLSLFEKWWLEVSKRRARSVSKDPVPTNDALAVESDRNTTDEDAFLQAAVAAASAPRRSTRISHQISSVSNEDQACRDCQLSAQEPFEGSQSLVWVPAKRSEWEDCISEMTALCTCAEIRRRALAQATPGASATKKPFHAPLSRDYISDRVDIDEPLNGYQIRHRSGGWLQGFVMWTNFTTWTHYFRWDSKHPQSGMPSVSSQDATPRNHISDAVDWDGSLAQKLESLPRTGDPMVGGVVFPNIAEISLVGGLGCGEYVLRMALDDIMRSKTTNGNSTDPQPYKFVVLQATESSRTFYERFGFVRIGAICRYHSNAASGSKKNANKKNNGKRKNVEPQGASIISETTGEAEQSKITEPPIVGYRHWTHANESDASLQMHGGPSYMMCLELPDPEDRPLLTSTSTRIQAVGSEEGEGSKTDCSSCGKKSGSSESLSILDAMMTLAVPGKPEVERLGGDDVTASMSQVANKSFESGTTGTPIPPSGKKKPNQWTSKGSYQTSSNVSVEMENRGSAKRKRKADDDSFSGNEKESGKSSSRKQKSRKISRKGSFSEAPVGTGGKRKKGTQATTIATTTTSMGKNGERTYHSVRGPDGRFTRVPFINGVPVFPTTTTTTTSSQIKRKKKVAPPTTPKAATKKKKQYKTSSSGSCKQIDRATLRKQKVKAYPRTRPHFYNRVVKAIGKKGKSKEYFFVLKYSEETEEMCIVPMAAEGDIMMGRRQGRPRYQCVLGATDENFMNVSCSGYQVVPAVMIMKTPIVSQEAWDIEDD